MTTRVCNPAWPSTSANTRAKTSTTAGAAPPRTRTGRQHSGLEEEAFANDSGTFYAMQASAIRWNAEWKARCGPSPASTARSGAFHSAFQRMALAYNRSAAVAQAGVP